MLASKWSARALLLRLSAVLGEHEVDALANKSVTTSTLTRKSTTRKTSKRVRRLTKSTTSTRIKMLKRPRKTLFFLTRERASRVFNTPTSKRVKRYPPTPMTVVSKSDLMAMP